MGAIAVLGTPYYDSAAEATAAMFYSLVQDHPFQDGNKRYAIVATQVSLLSNGIVCVASGEEWEVLALSVARGDLLKDALNEFFRDRLSDVFRDPEPGPSWAEHWSAHVGSEAITSVAELLRSLRTLVAAHRAAARSES